MEQVLFWGPALALAGLTAGLIALGLLRGARLRDGVGERRDLRIYADQLREVERDAARGLIAPEEAQRIRAEVARRLLDADRAEAPDLGVAPRTARILALLVAPAVVAVTLAVYLREGAPLYPDMPLAARHAEAEQMRAARPDQATAEAAWAAERPPIPEPEPQYAALMDQLRTVLATRPLDLTGHQLLAQNEATLGNFAAAARAQARVVELMGADVPLAEQVMLAEYMVAAAGGIVTPESEAMLDAILRRDPRNLQGRYYVGLMLAQTGRPDLTFQLWRGVLDDSTPDAPWVPSIRANIEDLAAVAGVGYTLPPLAAQGARGPSAEDIAAAADLGAEDRAAMIGAMVEGLAARLGNQGGPPEDWARLIQSLGVLGQVDRARAIWAEARLVFIESPEALDLIQAAGASLGFAP